MWNATPSFLRKTAFIVLALSGSISTLNGRTSGMPGSVPIASFRSCDNVTEGGEIVGDEYGCPDPEFDPSPILSVQLPSGGTGELEYLWIMTTLDPGLPVSAWTPIPGSNSAEFDPSPITTTTWYRRCSRRSGCEEYVAESNIVVKEIRCCDGFTDGGLIGPDQSNCTPFTPQLLQNLADPEGGTGTPAYFWYSSTVGPPFDPNTWTKIVGATDLSYQPPLLDVTTWYVRMAIREACTDSIASNLVVIVVQPEITFELETQHPRCADSEDGFLRVTPTAGGPVSITWNTGADSLMISMLPAGAYSFTLTDSLGCQVTGEALLTSPPSLELSGEATPATCFGGMDGAAQITVSGGTPPYLAEWQTSPPQGGLSIQNLMAGSYTVLITDSLLCQTSLTLVVEQGLEIIVTAQAQPVSCTGLADGSAEATASGGVPPYDFTWNTLPPQTGPTATQLPAGIVALQVLDAIGCPAYLLVNVPEATALALSIQKSDESCLNKQDGSARVVVSGGQAPYTFLWGAPLNSTTDTVANLPPGNYAVTVTDQLGCTASISVVIASSAKTCDCTLTLGDFVWYDFDRDGIQDPNELGINNIPVYLSQPGPDGEYGTVDDDIIKTSITSGFGFQTGYYRFENVCFGTYAICFDIDTLDYMFSPYQQGLNPFIDSDVLSSTGCTEPFTLDSLSGPDLSLDAGVHEYCVNIINPGQIGYDEELCFPGDIPSLIENVITPSGGVGEIEYLWIMSDVEPNYFPGNVNWMEIPNSNSPEYQPGPLAKTTYFLRCVRRNNCWEFQESNMVVKTVIDPKAIVLNNYQDPLCVDKGYLFNALSQGYGATYLWEFGPDATPPTASGSTVANVRWPTTGEKTIRLTVTVGNCTIDTLMVYNAEVCACRPVFIDFTAQFQDENVLLQWSADAWDEDHVFFAERALDTLSFEPFESVAGPAHTLKNYTLKDLQPYSGRSYYRIRMIDRRGNTDYSEIREVYPPHALSGELPLCFPNPLTDQLNIRFPRLDHPFIEWQAYDELGRLLGSQPLSSGISQVQLSTKDWPAGPILLVFTTKTGQPFSQVLQKLE